MKSRKCLLLIAILFMATVSSFPFSAGITEARQLGGGAFEGPRGGEAIVGPRGNVAVKGPQGNIAVGTRFSVLPDSANTVIVGDQTYYVDNNGIYYLPCDDDDAVYCVVLPPNN